MIVSSQKKIVFLHAAKTAGNSIKRALQTAIPDAEELLLHDQPHQSADEGRLQIAEWDSYLKFTVVRNPWERLVSLYAFTVKGAVPFRTFLNHSSRFALRPAILRRPLVLYANGAVVVLRFENLKEDFAKFCLRLGIDVDLPRVNVSEHRHYREYYDPVARFIVGDRYHEDVEQFGYHF